MDGDYYSSIMPLIKLSVTLKMVTKTTVYVETNYHRPLEKDTKKQRMYNLCQSF